MFDWQIILVGCALLLACAYMGWRGWLRLSSLSVSKRMKEPSCGDGCGGCEARQTKPELRTIPVQIQKIICCSEDSESRL